LVDDTLKVVQKNVEKIAPSAISDPSKLEVIGRCGVDEKNE